MEGSGIDQAWVEAGLYSPTTVTQILNGKHLYRALEAHTVTLLALYSLYFRKFLQLQPDEEAFLKETSTLLGEAYQQDIKTDSGSRHKLSDAITKTIEMFESRDIFQKIKQSEGTANKIQRFIGNYMKQFETILQFVRATRQRDLLLHMQSLESLMKYFFAHDHLNYARLLPLYISTMQQTEKQHPEIWAEFMKGNFCITKGVAGFTSIGPDHGIEQENRELKVIGDIVGITQNEKSLDKYFLIAPELSNLQHEFEKKYFTGSKAKRTQHHELTGGKLSRITQNAVKLSAVFHEHGNPFESADEDEIYNLLTQAVMNETDSNDILRRDEIGQQMFEGFVTERLMEGKLSVWDKMTKKKLGTFKSANAMTEIRMGDQVVKIKEERGLLQRFIVISRSRPELNLKECIGTYEFGVVPRSLFASDGSLLLAYDKASILHHLEKLDSNTQQDQADRNEATGSEPSDNQAIQVPLQVADTAVEHTNVDLTEESSAHRVIIIDGMAVVNSVSKTEQMKTCQDFADAFLQIICNMAALYEEVRLVFDRYIKTSLKEQMRTKRTKGKSTYYHVKDNTLIQYISLKDFLSDIRTKGELTEYLADKVVCHSKSSNNRLKKLMVTSGTQTKGNVDIPDSLLTHSQEEADTLLVLHALTVLNEAELVSSPDTDVLLLLVYMYPNLPTSTTFLTGKGRLKRNISVRSIYNNLGPKRASALLGFHALTGSDMCGRFAGRTKDSCFKAFMSCDDEILDALAMLGNDIDLPADVCSQLERFVCILYRSKIYTKVNELHWFLYSNRAAEAENLPPTSGSLDLHIRRAHYISMIWRKACETHPCLPAPTAFGWTFDAVSSHFSPVRCLNPPAPEAVLHLIKCGCKRGCEGRCSCRKNNIPCTEICGCCVFSCNNKTIQPGINEDCED